MICKICKKNEVNEVLNLGLQPLANKYPKNKNVFLVEKIFPLNLLFCSNCLNVQIKNIIDRKEMKEYTKNYNCEYFQPIPFRKLS